MAVAKRNFPRGKARAHGRLVDIQEAGQFCAMVADVSDFEGQVVRNGALDVHRPGTDIWASQIRIDRLRAAGKRIGTEAIAAHRGGWEDGTAGRAASCTGAGLSLPLRCELGAG